MASCNSGKLKYEIEKLEEGVDILVCTIDRLEKYIN